MGFASWIQNTFAGDKFTAQKGLRYIKKDYKGSYTEAQFDAIFLELAQREIDQQGQLLVIDQVERIAHRARVQARHAGRDQAPSTPATGESTVYSEEEMSADSTPRTMGTLSKEIYNRLNAQMQIIKTTTNPLLSEGELGTVRNMKLKTAQETIIRITQEMTTNAKARGVSAEQERAYKLEINRWRELANKLNDRLDRRMTTLEFKDYVNNFDKSFQETRSQAR